MYKTHCLAAHIFYTAAADGTKATTKGAKDKKGTKGQAKGAAPNDPEVTS